MKFKYIGDIGIDAANWQRSLSATSYGMDWGKFLPEDITIENARDANILKNYLEEKYYKSNEVGNYINWLEAHVNAAEIQNDLEDLMNKKFTMEEVTMQITTFRRAPYDVERSLVYMILRNSKQEVSITNIYHELMHFIFHIYFWNQCKEAGLSESQIHDLKESMTVLLNPILEKRGLPLDRGYPNHQELRAKLKKLWEEKDWEFENFLKEVLRQKLV